MESWKITIFCLIAKTFCGEPEKLFDIVFTSIRIKVKMPKQLLIKQTEIIS